MHVPSLKSNSWWCGGVFLCCIWPYSSSFACSSLNTNYDFFPQFCDISGLVITTREFSQIWLNVREESKKLWIFHIWALGSILSPQHRGNPILFYLPL
jgi:hypothetical protein